MLGVVRWKSLQIRTIRANVARNQSSSVDVAQRLSNLGRIRPDSTEIAKEWADSKPVLAEFGQIRLNPPRAGRAQA